MHLLEVRFHHTLDIHQGQHRLVLVVRQQLTLLRQSHGVDAMRFEYHYRQIGTHRNHHQRKEQVITTRQFGDEEDTCQRCVHHSRHQTRHAHQSEILLRYVVRNDRCQLISVAEMSKDETGDTAQEQARCKGTPTSATAIGSTRGKDFEKHNQREVNQQKIAISVEDGVIHHLVPISRTRPVQQHMNHIVTFTIERREHEDKDAQHRPPYRQLNIRIAVSTEHPFYPVHGTGEVQRHQTTKNTQQQHRRDTLHQERFIHVELKHRLCAMQDISHRSSSHTRH